MPLSTPSAKLHNWIFLATPIILIGFCVKLYRPDKRLSLLVNEYGSEVDGSKFIATKHSPNVHYRDEGRGGSLETTILLIHGTSSSLHTWEEGWKSELVKAGYRVITVDMCGFGLTGPNYSGSYTIPDLTDFLIDFMDVLKVDRFHVAGNSLGGNVAWDLQVSHPKRIKSLILVDSAGYKPNPKSVPLGFKLALTPV